MASEQLSVKEGSHPAVVARKDRGQVNPLPNCCSCWPTCWADTNEALLKEEEDDTHVPEEVTIDDPSIAQPIIS